MKEHIEILLNDLKHMKYSDNTTHELKTSFRQYESVVKEFYKLFPNEGYRFINGLIDEESSHLHNLSTKASKTRRFDSYKNLKSNMVGDLEDMLTIIDIKNNA
ncbi:hypothetical protein [Pedobacter chitinilyticus]|uniref:Uncharacterized protein n=1 Tax=Pedobacter chitinilyticus TaxID=2233776 RepID=A0A443Z030_9SPHI|nr:hypothetical protein [Pedobacter chitinilyticus]RWU09882.1 hypothetical protein DPV69_00610 [Pedobacter chitinilyticus]